MGAALMDAITKATKFTKFTCEFCGREYEDGIEACTSDDCPGK